MLDSYVSFGVPEDSRSESRVQAELKEAAAVTNRLVECMKICRAYIKVVNDAANALAF